MGNQLAGIAPSQILPVEHYLTDVVDYEYDISLGSTRFLKVARARYNEGLAVVKVFVIHDPSLPLKTYKECLENIKSTLFGASNCLPFQKATLSEKAGLMFRQYIKDSLYDRISTRPFLINIEKKWIAFQLLCALNQSHKINVCHGDIKSENVMITSWNWLLLTDFASFKPAYLPEDNPADFSYFFDTSRRRTCYIAPERFVERHKTSELASGTIDLAGSHVNNDELVPTMDIFSAGCVIIELFTEGSAPFDLAQLLSYRIGEYSPWKILQKIDNPNIRALAQSMIQKDPSHRLSAEEYLIQQRGKAFPEYFYTFLKLYLQRFACVPVVAADDRIARLMRDLGMIMNKIKPLDSDQPDQSGVIIVLSLLTASLRDAKYASTKVLALELMDTFSQWISAELILERLVPYMLHLVQDTDRRVRAEALRRLTACLSAMNTVPRSDANIFPEYILPQLNHLTNDKVVAVRVAYAENIAQLAETALKFLEMVHLAKDTGDKVDTEMDEMVSTYDSELQALHETIQQKVTTLLSDPDNIVKRTLLEKGITRLCVFFGRQKANDVLLSHMITFLNDKNDWHLRAAFFDSIVGLVAYVGWQSSTILKPLLQQGLTDTEEYVIHKALVAITSLTELGLLQRTILHDLLKEIVSFFCHPNVWIRHSAVGVVSTVARAFNVADVHCNLMPLIKPFLKHSIIQVDKEVVLLNAIREPIARPVYDYVLKSNEIEQIFRTLHNRRVIRKLCRPGHQPNYSETDETLTQVLRKLQSQGMFDSDEDKLYELKEIMLKISSGKSSSNESGSNQATDDLELKHLGGSLVRRHADLVKAKESIGPKKSTKKKSSTTDPSLMNEEWKHMFGTEEKSKSLKQRPSLEKQYSIQGSISVLTMSALQSSVEGTPVKKAQVDPDRSQAVQARAAACKMELRNLVHERRDQFVVDCTMQDLQDSETTDNKQSSVFWRPKGLLVAHLHEHRAAVNRIQVSQDHTWFATCSNDGSVKIWECDRMEGKSITNRSKYTYNKQGGQIKCIEFCEGSNSLAMASDNGTIHVIRLDSETSRIVLEKNEQIDLNDSGHVVDMKQIDTGAQCILTYATVNGDIRGWDFRAPRLAWKLKNDPKLGLITSYTIHPSQSWLSAGTSSGRLMAWDLRFQLPITTVVHPTGARVRRLLSHPKQCSHVIASVQGNNEVSVWDLENGARQTTFWASSAPALSSTQHSSHSSCGVYVSSTDPMFLLTAGSDMRIRYWNVHNPDKSFIVAGSASDPVNQGTIVSYRSQYIEGTQVIQEMYTKATKTGHREDPPYRSAESPPVGHHDTITDISVFQTGQRFVVTSSRDGVVKVWK